jgi:hypothetical protein
MNIRQQRNEKPASIEEIGLGKWHFRWDIQEKTDKNEDESQLIYYDYNEVELDHKPTTAEKTAIKKQYA